MHRHLKIRIDWHAVAATISKKYNQQYSSSYCRDVGTGIHQNKRVQESINEILAKELSKPITINPKTLFKEV